MKNLGVGSLVLISPPCVVGLVVGFHVGLLVVGSDIGFIGGIVDSIIGFIVGVYDVGLTVVG